MKPTFEVVDEFTNRMKAVRQRRSRIFLPVSLVFLVIASLVAITNFSYRANRTDALKLTDDVIESLQQRIETEVEAYLAPVSQLAELARDLLGNERVKVIRWELAEPLALQILNNNPQITIFSLGLENGDYLMVRRDQAFSGFSTKLIEYKNGLPEMTWTRRNVDMQIIGREKAAWDDFDPRTRPWYQGADRLRGLFWTDVYVFFTDRAPGITVSVPFLDEAGKLLGVLGLDITLENLSRFLAGLEIGRSGGAFIVDKAGQLIAHSDFRQITVQDGDSLKLRGIKDLNDPVLSRAFDRFRVEGLGHRIFAVDGRRYIGAATSLQHLLQQDWSALIVVPEDDFVGFVRENVRKTALMALSLIVLAALLAALLVRQGLRADRNASLVLSRQAELERQGDAFATLAGQATLFEEGNQSALALLTEKVCQAVGIRRASVWEFDKHKEHLHCIDCYDENSEGHTGGLLLARNDYPLLFEALTAGNVLAITDAAKDLRFEALHRIYLAPLVCQALLSTPVRSHCRVVGALWLEAGADRAEWGQQTQAFAKAVANLLAVRYSATEQNALNVPDQTVHSKICMEPTQTVQQQLFASAVDSNTTLGRCRATAFAERLTASARERGVSKLQVIDALSVMVLRFMDETALAMDMAESQPAVNFLIDKLEQLAGEHNITYLKFMSDQVVAAAGIDSDPTMGMIQTAEYALVIRDLCRQFFAERHSHLMFRIGLDHGPAIGSIIGSSQQSYNLCGEAVRMATTMADTSLQGSIQATESVYRVLRDHYLFQVRGAHYLENVGVLTTYIMSGRL